MRRILFLAALVLALCVMPALARDAFKAELLATTVLDDDPTTVTSSGVDISQYDRVAMWVTYDETEVALAISAVVTFEVSYDDTTYVTANFYDYAGGSTLQTSETISADSTFLAWLDRTLNAPYVRVKIVATNTDADDILSVSATISAQK